MVQRDFEPTKWTERLHDRLKDLVDYERSVEYTLWDLIRQDERLLGLSSTTCGDFKDNIRRRVDRYTTVARSGPPDDAVYWQGVHIRLNSLIEVLREHPVMDQAIYASDGELVIGLDLSVTRVRCHQVCFVVAGLVDYAVEHGPQAAANAFTRLIDDGERQQLTSYEMVLFRGLHVERRHEISQDLFVIPWEEAQQYIHGFSANR